MYQDRALVQRTTKVKLEKGENEIQITGLTPLLVDESVRGSLPQSSRARILAITVGVKALVENRQKEISDLENAIYKLREEDEIFADKLSAADRQLIFLDSLQNLSSEAAQREIREGKISVKGWEESMTFIASKRESIIKQRRKTEKDREELGKKIQLLEFELRKLAGPGYLNSTNLVWEGLRKNRAQTEAQSFQPYMNAYEEKRKIYSNPAANLPTEKRISLRVFSPKTEEIDLNTSYLVYNTSWNMDYDIRVSSQSSAVDMTLFGNIYQQTGENWENIALTLSTGAPRTTLYQAQTSPWILDLYTAPPASSKKAAGNVRSKAAQVQMMKDEVSSADAEYSEGEAVLEEAQINSEGPSVELRLPEKQSLLSVNEPQKRFLKDTTMAANNAFYYEIFPEINSSGYLKTKIRNTSDIPWLPGRAQLFLENEYMGNANIPYLPVNKEYELLVAQEEKLLAKKVLLRKFEDKSGIFGGKRRIRYEYRLEVESLLGKDATVYVYDQLPVSRNEKIVAEVENISPATDKDADFIASSAAASGRVRWLLALRKNGKQQIRYDVVITFDEKDKISGLR